MIYFNDASLHGQFPALGPFKESLRTIWEIRNALLGKGLQLRVCRTVRSRQVTLSETFNDFLGSIPKELKVPLLLWLDRDGPFWDDGRHHSDGEFFECAGELVTDTGAAEAAFNQAEGTLAWLFTLNPSMFLFDPLEVKWLDREGGDVRLRVPNGWTLEDTERCAEECEQPLSSWDELLEWALSRCPNLLLSSEISSQLPKRFDRVVAQRSQVLLSVLDQMVDHLNRGDSDAFEELRVNWMHGDNARFSPSSPSEIDDFEAVLTFNNPRSNKKVLCSWHGKISRLTTRIHFEWPLPEGESRLFVAYIGRKITIR